MLLCGHGEAADRMSCDAASISDGLDDSFADFVAAGGDDGDAVIVGAAGLNVEVQALLWKYPS
jgi:hypothetical protein